MHYREIKLPDTNSIVLCLPLQIVWWLYLVKCAATATRDKQHVTMHDSTHPVFCMYGTHSHIHTFTHGISLHHFGQRHITDGSVESPTLTQVALHRSSGPGTNHEVTSNCSRNEADDAVLVLE